MRSCRCKIMNNKAMGFGLVEVLVSLTIMSMLMLASLSYALSCIKLSQNCLWDSGTISCFSSFFERVQLYPEKMQSGSSLDVELNNLNQVLKTHAPLTSARIEFTSEDEIKLVMVREANRNSLRVAKVEAIIQ